MGIILFTKKTNSSPKWRNAIRPKIVVRSSHLIYPKRNAGSDWGLQSELYVFTSEPNCAPLAGDAAKNILGRSTTVHFRD